MSVLNTIIQGISTLTDYANRNRYDHHQRSFSETFSSMHSTKLSSAGLVFKHFGKEVIPVLGDKHDISADELQLVYQRCYEGYVEGIDGIDNGISPYVLDGCSCSKGKVRRAYWLNGISSIVDRLNPLLEHETADDQFRKAVQVIGDDFKRIVYYLVHRWVPARHVVQSALGHCKQYDSKGRILVLHSAEPWRSHLFELEKEAGVRVEYVLFPETHSTHWMIQAVPVSEEAEFEDRRSFPEHWRGNRDEKLSELIGINGCIFVHNSGFIAGNMTFEGALDMARKALEEDSMENQCKKQKPNETKDQ